MGNRSEREDCAQGMCPTQQWALKVENSGLRWICIVLSEGSAYLGLRNCCKGVSIETTRTQDLLPSLDERGSTMGKMIVLHVTDRFVLWHPTWSQTEE